MEQELKEPGRFKDFYQFTFNFAKNPGQKGLGKNILKLYLVFYIYLNTLIVYHFCNRKSCGLNIML
jgi:hypothetical protein